MDLKTEIMEITPKLAGEMLTLNKDNRKMSSHAVAVYAHKMLSGQWKLTHQGIAFDEEGFLLDGQTRLAAVIQSGCTVPMMVTMGAMRDTFKNLDSGRHRSAGQVLDVPNAYGVAAALRVLIALQRGLTLGSRGSIPTEDVFEELGRQPEVIDAVHQALSVNKASGLPVAMHGAVLTIAIKTPYHSRIDSWIYGLREGVGLEKDSPIRLLRNRFTAMTARQVGTPDVVLALITKAWNAHAIGKPLGQLKLAAGEPLPRVVGYLSEMHRSA